MERNLLLEFVRHMPAAVAMFDREMRYVQASDRWCADYGLDPEQVAGKRHYDFFPDLPQGWKDAHRRSLAGETLRADADRFELGGREMWVKWEMRPWGNVGGLPDGVIIYAEDVTERKLAGSAVADLRAAVDVMTDGLVISDQMGSRLYFNEGFAKFLRFPSKAACPASLAEYPALLKAYLPDGQAAELDQWAVPRALRGETATDQEYTLQRMDTGHVWVGSFNFAPIRDENGAITGAVVVGRDITQQKKNEQRLFDMTLMYQGLFNNSPDGIARLDLAGRYVFANQRMAALAGCDGRDFLGKLVGTMGSGEPDFWLSRFRKTVDSKQVETVEVPFSGREQLNLTVRLIPEMDNSGKVQSVLLIATDVTGLRAAESQASERQAIISALFDSAAQAILAVDREGRIQLANRMVSDLFGYEPEELLGKPIEALIAEDLKMKHEAHREVFMANPIPRPLGLGADLQARKKDGTLFPVEVSLGIVNRPGGILVVAMLADISQRKRQEGKLLESAEKVRQLGVSLLTAEEEAARRIARELHDDVTQRLVYLSLQIGKLVGDPQTGALIPQLRSFWARVMEISDAIRRISHQMHPSILDDLGLPAAIESLCLEHTSGTGVNVHFEARGILSEEVDRKVASCLYRVCQECLRNIEKHARAEEVSVSLSESGGWLQLEVLDTGVGFDPSVTAPGLGRRSMEERVRMVDGRFELESAPGEGTRTVVRVRAKRLQG